jgi:nucleotide-binding universal stress UspA family protein
MLVVHALAPVPAVLPAGVGQVSFNVDSYRDVLLKNAQVEIETVVRRRIPSDIEFSTEIRWGTPAETIVEVSRERTFDLIVICTRGATGLSRFVSGSVTEKVVRLADVPVLTVQAENND